MMEAQTLDNFYPGLTGLAFVEVHAFLKPSLKLGLPWVQLVQGEMEPTPYFYQNLGEAEMVVSIYCFMRLLGYPAEKITILTTYNGQKHLIRDVVERRCASHPLFGRPAKVGASLGCGV
jgi:hypothetical protein